MLLFVKRRFGIIVLNESVAGSKRRERSDNNCEISEEAYTFNTQARSQGGGVQGVLENPPFYEPPFLENTNPPPIAYKCCNKPQLSEYSIGPMAGRSREMH